MLFYKWLMDKLLFVKMGGLSRVKAGQGDDEVQIWCIWVLQAGKTGICAGWEEWEKERDEISRCQNEKRLKICARMRTAYAALRRGK
jgi:hypothetical protein